MKEWQKSLVEEWNLRQVVEKSKKRSEFPLIEQNFEAEEILAMTEILLSGQLTMSQQVREFEKKFAEFVQAPFAVMVNSGSSANLLALAVATNPLREKRLKAGDEVLVPSVCWSTSVWPLIQMGLTPVFVDVDPRTLNIDLSSMKKALTSRTRGLMAVHILGNCGPMDEVLSLAREKNLILIEDTCESLGSLWNGKALGTLGEFGTYSFYFSHHMTTGEGGMVVCRTQEDADLLKCLRAHGWTRELSQKETIEKRFPDVDPRFLFVNVGYNLRPMEIQAALGLQQLKKLNRMNESRVQNWKNLTEALRSHKNWQEQFLFPVAPEGSRPVWFGFPLVLSEKVQKPLQAFLKELSSLGVENRPIVSGNFARQPGLALFQVPQNQDLPGAEIVHNRGFFIGLHSEILEREKIQRLAEILLSIF